MGKISHFVQLLLCVCLWIQLCQPDCPYQECFCSGRIISCSDKDLQAFPTVVRTNANFHWSLDIDSNNISRVPNGGLPPNVTDIDLDDNPITTIDDNAFDESAATLTWLYFANVRFTRFPDAFGHLRALTHLSISGANITDWNDDAWMNIGPTLQLLDLEDVGITIWPSWTRYFTNMSELTIVWGSFTSIPDGALDSVAHSLTSLSLNNNLLTKVPKALSNLKSLQTLYLQDNHIADVRWLPQTSTLSMLSLSYNYIWNVSQLTEVLRPYNTSLSSFDIDNNHLTSIPEITYLITVRALDFTHNRISDPISGAIASNVFILDLSYNSLPFVHKMISKLLILTDIPLSYNAIVAIRDTDFHQNTTTIDLSYNLITELTDTSFPENFALQEFELNNNPLTTISAIALQHLPNLQYLNLRYTKLTRLPLGLSSLRSLISLDTTNSSMLVCTCMESSLTTWIMKMRPYNVQGNCGHTSIYDFFSILSPSCPATAALTQ